MDRYTKMLNNKDVQQLLAARPVLKDTVEQIVELNQMIKVIYFSEMPSDQKSETIINLYKATNTISREVVNALYSSKELSSVSKMLNRQRGLEENLINRPVIATVPDVISKPMKAGLEKIRGFLNAE